MRKPKVSEKENQIENLQLQGRMIQKLIADWKIPTSKVRLDKKSFKTWLVFADSHVPHENREVMRVLFKLTEDIKFDGMCIAGDYMDLGCISHWNKGRLKTLEGQRLVDDYVKGNAILDEFDKRLAKDCEKIYLYGNHERFYYDLIDEYPVLEGTGSPENCLKLKERGYKVYTTQNEIIKLGKLSVTHGMYTGDTAVKKHVQAFMTNVLFGHVHTQAEFCAPSPAKEISTYGASLGCTCDMNPDYMKNACHKWTHGFAIVYIYDREYFDVDLKRVINGKVIFNNKLYDGSK